MKGISECINYMVNNEGEMISTIFGCQIVCWYSEGSFFQTTSFDFSESEVLDDFNHFDTMAWHALDPKIKKRIKFEIDLGCLCSQPHEVVEMEFPWDSNVKDIDEIINRRLNEWVLESISSHYEELEFPNIKANHNKI